MKYENINLIRIKEEIKKDYWKARLEASNIESQSLFSSKQENQILDEVNRIISNDRVFDELSNESYTFNMIYTLAADNLHSKKKLITAI